MSPAPADRPLAVIVVTHNSEAVLGGLIDSLATGLEGLTWQLQLVDNGSGDATVAQARARLPAVRVTEMGGNFGYAAAVNRGLSDADTRADVLLLNPDVRLHPGAGRALRDAVATQGVGISAPRTLERRREAGAGAPPRAVGEPGPGRGAVRLAASRGARLG